MRNTISAVLAAGIAGLGLLYAFWGVDLARLVTLLGKGNYWAVFPYLVGLWFYYFFTATRWVILLGPIGRFSVRQVVPAMMIGFAWNNLLPARLGELMRTLHFARQFSRSRSAVLMTLVLERMLDVVAIVFFYVVSVALIDPFPQSIRLGFTAIAWVMGGLLALIIAFLWNQHLFIALWHRGSFWLPRTFRQMGSRFLSNAAAGLESTKSVPAVLAMLAYSLLKWLGNGGMVWAAMLAYGEPISLGLGMIVIAVSALAVTLPAAPGAVGLVQAAFVFALTPFGIDHEIALAASLFYLVAHWVPVTAVGGAYILTSGLPVGALRREKVLED